MSEHTDKATETTQPIDWRARIDRKWLVPNKQNFEKRNLPVPETIDGLEDKDLLILLGGIRTLAKDRRFSSVKYTVTSPSPDQVISVCEITWEPHEETQNRVITFSAIGDANPLNTNGFGRNYLGPIAENRSFVRAVRGFLNIAVLGADEISNTVQPEQESPPTNSPAATLEAAASAKNFTFEDVKKSLIKSGYEKASELNCYSDIPPIKIFELLARINNAPAKTKT